MKKHFLTITLAAFTLFGVAKAQEGKSWNVPTNQITFTSSSGDESQLSIDQGFNYADFASNGRKYHIFYQRGIASLRKVRIIDTESNLQVAKGKGSYFWGNARFEFVDGEEFKVRKKKNANGYEITGPSGLLFAIENHAIKAVNPLTEKDLLTQAFYVFERVKSTQKPTQDVIYYTSFNNYTSSKP